VSALPVEDQPSGAVPAHTGTGSRGLRSRPGGTTVRSGGVTARPGGAAARPGGFAARPGGAAARPAVHPLLPARKWLLPDGDCIFPGGGRSFSGRPAPGRSFPGRPAPGAVRAGAGLAWPEARAARPATGIVPSGPGAQRPVRPWADARQSVRPLPSVPVLSGAVVTAPGRAGLWPTRRPGLRLTRRGRIVLAVLAVLAVCGLFVAGASAAQASGPAAHGAPGTAEQVIVQPGDSLWSIAQGADPNADARAIVQEILQANRLKTVNLTAGQRLWVPRG